MVRAEPISSQISQAFHRSVLDPEQPGNYYFSLYVTDMWNSKSVTKVKDLGYCSGVVTTIIMSSLYVASLPSYDVVCLRLMIQASGSMVFILWRHKQSVQDIHKQSPLSQIFP